MGLESNTRNIPNTSDITNALKLSFNPFEIAKNFEAASSVKFNKFVSNKSKSDVGQYDSFLNRIEDSSDNQNGRRSDFIPRQKPLASINRLLTCGAKSPNSNKELSGNQK